MNQKDVLHLLEVVYNHENSYTPEERNRAKLQLEELIRTLIPE